MPESPTATRDFGNSKRKTIRKKLFARPSIPAARYQESNGKNQEGMGRNGKGREGMKGEGKEGRKEGETMA